MVWYSHLFQNFPQFIVIHTVKGFGIVNKAEIDGFLGLTFIFAFISINLGGGTKNILLQFMSVFCLCFPIEFCIILPYIYVVSRFSVYVCVWC